MPKVKQGWEDKEFWGMAGAELIKGKRLSDLSSKQLQAILDGDPANASLMIEGDATAPSATDNNPDAPLPAKPKKTE